MNWDAIGAIAELLGAVGVIASLVYLATQIRHSREQMEQNTRTTRASAYQEFTGQLHSTMMSAGENPQWEQAVMKGWADFSRLSKEDAFRFTLYMTGVANAFDNAHYQHRLGMLDEDRWQKHYADVRTIFQFPGVAQWWRATPVNVSPKFGALVDEILGEEADRGE